MSEQHSLRQPLALSDSPECSLTLWNRCRKGFGAAVKKGMVGNCTPLSFTDINLLSAEQNCNGNVCFPALYYSYIVGYVFSILRSFSFNLSEGKSSG